MKIETYGHRPIKAFLDNFKIRRGWGSTWTKTNPEHDKHEEEL